MARLLLEEVNALVEHVSSSATSAAHRATAHTHTTTHAAAHSHTALTTFIAHTGLLTLEARVLEASAGVLVVISVVAEVVVVVIEVLHNG